MNMSTSTVFLSLLRDVTWNESFSCFLFPLSSFVWSLILSLLSFQHLPTELLKTKENKRVKRKEDKYPHHPFENLGLTRSDNQCNQTQLAHYEPSNSIPKHDENRLLFIYLKKKQQKVF